MIFIVNLEGPTPETDKWSAGSHVVPTWFAQKLERERNTLKQKLDKLTAEYKDNGK